MRIVLRKPAAQFLISFILLGIGSAAFAHPGHDVSGLSAGLMHPFSGFDHLLAMVAVGLWAAQNGGRKIWLLPAAFMLMMAAGAKCALIYPFLPQHHKLFPFLKVGFGTELLQQIKAYLQIGSRRHA